MSKTTLLLALYGLLLVGAAIHAAVMYPRLPEEIAVHFGGAGKPNGWMPKQSMYGLYAGMVALEMLMFVGIAFFIGKFPASLINLPNKYIWLAEPHRANTLRILREQMLLFGVVTCAYLIGVMVMVFDANLNPPPVLDETRFLIAIIGFLAFTLFWCIWLIAKFRKPKADPYAQELSRANQHPSE